MMMGVEVGLTVGDGVTVGMGVSVGVAESAIATLSGVGTGVGMRVAVLTTTKGEGAGGGELEELVGQPTIKTNPAVATATSTAIQMTDFEENRPLWPLGKCLTGG